MITRKSLIGALVAAVLCGSASAEEPMMRVAFNIAPQPIGRALTDLGEQAGLQVLVRGDDLKTRKTLSEPVNGELTVRAALERVLADSGLTYEFLDARTVRVRTVESERGQKTIEATATETKEGERPLVLAQSHPRSTEAVAQAASDERRAAQMNKDAMQEVLVTAQKRLERLQDVPIPVTALSGESLVDHNQVRIQDFYSRVPTLNFTMGLRGEPTLAIRGMTTNWAGNPTVGVVVDDIPYGASTANGGGFASPDIDPSDIEQLEVLRGPQGTLYGASSLGGLLKFVTVDPSTDRLTGRVQAGLSGVRNGDETGYNVRGAVNVPMGDTFAVRASGFKRSDPGYIDDPTRGARGVNSADANGGRFAALWRPSDALSMKLSALIQNNDRHGSPEVHRLAGLGDLQQDSLRGTGDYSTKTRLFTATIGARLGSVDLTLLSGYNDNSWSANIDNTSFCGSTGAGYSDAFFGVAGCSLPEEASTKKYTQEVRLAGTAGSRTDWLLGLFYTDEKTDWFQQLLAIDPASGSSAGSILDYTFGPTKFEERAAFAAVTYHFTDQFDVQLGGRQSHNEQRHDETGIGPLFGGVEFPSPTIRTDADAFTYMVTPRFKLAPDVMVYARLASGYRPGGPNQLTALGPFPSSFDPDRSYNYELGIKGEVLDRKLSIDASVYYIDWKDLQVNIRDPGTFFNYTANASRARSQGVDLTLTSRPVQGLTLSGWVAWNDAELTEDFPVGSTSAGRSGDRLPFSSRFSGNLSLDQDFPLGAMSGFVGSTLSYVGERKGGFATTSERQSLSAYAQIDMRAGIRKDEWLLNAFINNIGDRRGLLSGGLGASNPIAFTYIQPRTAGVSVTRTF